MARWCFGSIPKNANAASNWKIATVNGKNGTIKPRGNTELTAPDLAKINGWLTARDVDDILRDVDDILRAVGYLNITTQWVQTKASDDQLERVTDDLLRAMHDPHSVLVRRTADRLTKGAAE